MTNAIATRLLVVLGLCGPFIGIAGAQDQDDVMRAGAIAAREARPLEECLKAEIERSKPASNFEAQTVITTSCQDIEALVRPKVIEALGTISYTPPASTADLERVADAALRMLKAKAYFEFTGQLRSHGLQGSRKPN